MDQVCACARPPAFATTDAEWAAEAFAGTTVSCACGALARFDPAANLFEIREAPPFQIPPYHANGLWVFKGEETGE